MTDTTTIFMDAGYLITVTNQKRKKIDFIKLSNEISTNTWKKTLVYDALPKFDDPRYSKAQHIL